MKIVKTMAAAAAALSMAFGANSALAQESAGTPGTVWIFSSIQVEPGHFEKYLDYLSGNWKRIQEAGRKEGYLVSYHVWAVNQPRAAEPDLILGLEFKDYVSNAEQLAIQKRVEALLQSDTHKLDVQAGERQAMRKVISNMQLQELKLK